MTSLHVAGIASLALAAGAANTLLSAAVMATDCPSTCRGGGTAFGRPGFVTLVAFLAQAACAPTAAAVGYLRRCAAGTSTSPATTTSSVRLLDGDIDYAEGASEELATQPALRCSAAWLRRASVLLVPAALDVASTAAATASLLFVSASVSTATRGVLLLFSLAAARAAGSSRVRDGAAGLSEWVGVIVSTIGVALVGLGAVLAAGNGAVTSSVAGLAPAAATATGIGLALAGNFFMATQVVIETSTIEASTFSPADVNSIEGVLGAALLAVGLGVAQAVPSPGSGNVPLEDSADTACCLGASPALAGATAALFIAFCLSTSSTMELSALRGASFRSLVIVSRTMLVWAVELVFAYAPAALAPADDAAAADDFATRYGVRWTAWSWLQLAGCVALAAGAAVTWRGQSAREAHAAAALKDVAWEEADVAIA